MASETLPRPPDQLQQWTGETSGEESARRQQRLRLHMLERRGKGGYR